MLRRPLRRRDFLKAIPAFSALSLLGASRAKITDIRLRSLKLLREVGTYPDWVGGTRFSRIGGGGITEIHTDQGVTGIGPDIDPAQLGRMKAMLVGADPFDMEAHAERLSGGPSSGLRGPASVEIALWDLVGKLTNQPLYKLWGGGKEKVPPYSSMLSLGTPEERADKAVQLKEAGWQAVKWRCSFPTLKDDIRLVELTRKAVGDDWVITADGNKAGLRMGATRGVFWEFARAAQTAKEYQRMNVYFLEEPLPRYDFDHIAELNRMSDMMIVGGEGNRGLHEFRWLLEKGCYDLVQPEIMTVGPSQMMKTAVIAESMNKMIIPHVGDMRLGTICNLHLIATWRNSPYIEIFNEIPVGDYTYPFSIFEEPPVLDKQGFFQVPQGPGLGMTIKKEFLEDA